MFVPKKYDRRIGLHRRASAEGTVHTGKVWKKDRLDKCKNREKIDKAISESIDH